MSLLVYVGAANSVHFGPQESQLSEDNPPQKPLPVFRPELDRHCGLADDRSQQTSTHLPLFCEAPLQKPAKIWDATD